MAEISPLFVEKLANNPLLASFSASISDILADLASLPLAFKENLIKPIII